MISARWWQKYNVSLDFERFCTFTAQKSLAIYGHKTTEESYSII